MASRASSTRAISGAEFHRMRRLLSQPAVSQNHIAFAYADDLWICDLDGRNVRRLTSDVGVESNPVFSPDGQTLAFSGEYDGNTDVYTVAERTKLPLFREVMSKQRICCEVGLFPKWRGQPIGFIRLSRHGQA